jgi:hypothetical protein
MTDALALVDHALNTGEGPANGLYVPEIHRLRGVFLKSLGSPAEEVERALRTALELAEDQGASCSNFALPQVSHASGAIRISGKRLASFSLRSTPGSPKALTRLT